MIGFDDDLKAIYANSSPFTTPLFVRGLSGAFCHGLFRENHVDDKHGRVSVSGRAPMFEGPSSPLDRLQALDFVTIQNRQFQIKSLKSHAHGVTSIYLSEVD